MISRKTFNGMHKHLLPLTDPTSPFLENYRRLYQKISYFHKEQAMRTLGITSASVGEGKTLTSINLALSIAEDASNRVALLDCDFRRPKIQTYLGISTDKGLVDVIRGKAEVKEVATSVGEDKENLKVFLLGNMDTVSEKEVYSFLYEKKMAPILQELKTDFDYIIVDTPPILPIVDITFLSELFDALLLIIRAGKTSKDQVQAALETLGGKKNIIGTVFNGINRQLSSRYSYNYYSYYSSSKKHQKKSTSSGL